MLLITKVGSPTVGLRAPVLGACGGAFGFLAFGFFTDLSALLELELAGLAAVAESGRTARGEAGLAMGLARGVDDMLLPVVLSSGHSHPLFSSLAEGALE